MEPILMKASQSQWSDIFALSTESSLMLAVLLFLVATMKIIHGIKSNLDKLCTNLLNT